MSWLRRLLGRRAQLGLPNMDDEHQVFLQKIQEVEQAQAEAVQRQAEALQIIRELRMYARSLRQGECDVRDRERDNL